jgi:hypothetical protein
MDQNKLLVEPCHQGVPWGLYKTISEPVVRLAQTVHLSCIDKNTIVKRTDTRFHRTDVTNKFVLVQHRCMVCLEHTIGLETILDAPDNS